MSQELKERTELLQEPQIPSAPPKQSGGHGLAKLAAVMSALALVISCVALFLVLRPINPSVPQEPEEPAQPMTVDAGPTVTYRDRELPVFENVAVNQYDKACFGVNDQGWITYQEDGLSAKMGVDVSAYQEDIDWKRVADSGIRFAMIRCGYRGYANGVVVEDKLFQKNIKGALDAGLEVGVYFFSQATNVWEAQEEADYVLNAIKGYDITYPVAFDWEFIAGTSQARTNGMEADDITRCAGAFCDMVAEAGYEPVIYFNQDLGYLSYELDALTDYTFWLAEYNKTPSFYYHFDLWQYTHRGTVPGIKGSVDLNLDFRTMT